MELALEIRVQNYGPTPMTIEANLVLPTDWVVSPSTLRMEVPAKGVGVYVASVAISDAWTPRASRFAIAADIVVNGKHVGEIAEAICEVAGTAPNLESWA